MNCYIVICRIINNSIIKMHAERRKRKTQEETTQEWRTHEETTGRKTQEDFFNNILPLTLFVRVRKGCWRITCERMLETEHKLHILTPLLWPSRCVLFSWCWGPLHGGFPRAPSVGCGLPLPHLVSTVWNYTGNCFCTPNSTELNNNSTPTRSPTGSSKSDV